MQRSTDIRKYFAYELSPQPTSLFKDNYMRKTDKSQLAKEMRKDCTSAVVPRGSTVVVDGGYLLRVVRWTKGSTYSDVCQHSMWTMWDSIMVDPLLSSSMVTTTAVALRITNTRDGQHVTLLTFQLSL